MFYKLFNNKGDNNMRYVGNYKKDTTSFLLREIPVDMWRKFKIKSMENERENLQDALHTLIDSYVNENSER